MSIHNFEEVVKLIIEDEITYKFDSDDGFMYLMCGDSIANLVWQFIYSNVGFANNKSNKYRLTLEAI
jgi:hypothetical protein